MNNEQKLDKINGFLRDEFDYKGRWLVEGEIDDQDANDERATTKTETENQRLNRWIRGEPRRGA